MGVRWQFVGLVGALCVLLRPAPLAAAACGGPPTALFTRCGAATIAPDCSLASPLSWPAAEPVRIGVSCTDFACPPPFPHCPPYPAGCHTAPSASTPSYPWQLRRGSQTLRGSFQPTDITCSQHAAVFEYDRLLEPDDNYALIYDTGVDYFDIVITGTLPPATATPTPTPTALPCVGDCNEDGAVRVEELMTGINIALDRADGSNCPLLFDCMIGGGIHLVSCMTQAVNNAMVGCSANRN